MKSSFVVILIFLVNSLFGQDSKQMTIATREVTIKYADSKEVFLVCIKNPSITYVNSKKYYWYNEEHNIKSTEGGAGGFILHGIYKLYDADGNLRSEVNYKMGLKDGVAKDWDDSGFLHQISRYSAGEMIYWKFYDYNNDHWIELDKVNKLIGNTRKVYDKYGILLLEEISISAEVKHVKTYYEFTGKLKADYNERLGMFMTGAYLSYYENGKLHAQGQFYELNGLFSSIKTGVWKYYKADGTLEGVDTCKAEISYWDNGKFKCTGGYVFDETSRMWVETGEWNWYNIDGKFLRRKKYVGGVEVED